MSSKDVQQEGRGREDPKASETKSYLPAVNLASFSPWGSRSTTPKPAQTEGTGGNGGLGKQKGGDHVISHRHRLSLKRYPRDCPPLNVKWYYAVDVPKRKPLSLKQTPSDGRPPPIPKKYVAFSSHDSRAIEMAFQKLSEEEDAQDYIRDRSREGGAGESAAIEQPKANPKIEAEKESDEPGKVQVPVQEDHLFDVDIERRELGPAYWLGPIYEVRRGTWFTQEGNVLKPCDESLATQLEEGYLKVKPFRYMQQQQQQQPASSAPPQPSDKPQSEGSVDSPPDILEDMSKQTASKPETVEGTNTSNQTLQTHRLFGAYMNSVVTYQDATVAWMLTDDLVSRMSSTVYGRFGGGAHLGGIKYIRGYTDLSKSKDAEKKADTSVELDTKDNKNGNAEKARKRKSAPASTSSLDLTRVITGDRDGPTRDVSSDDFKDLVGSEDPMQREEEIRRRDEQEIQDDYRNDGGEEQDREIEHLLLVTHGIGQRLGLRIESVNFIHDVNVLRKTLKSVYGSSADLQALNQEIDKLPKNCKIQVLPVCWRHLLDFPKQGLRQNRKEHDLGDADDFGQDEEYPSLNDITIEGVPQVRSLITDLALDILLYQSAYREHISGIVLRECNRVYNLFVQRNPNFKGKVSLVGHSLGSAIFFDILCRQKGADDNKKQPSDPARFYHNRPGVSHRSKEGKDLRLDFNVEDFFCLGSPIGLFQMLKGRTIAARSLPDFISTASSDDLDGLDDPFLGMPAQTLPKKTSRVTHLPYTVSSPKCSQLFNVFHPSDPIAYRLEPLISPAMSSLKPQPLPYTKKGIFGAPGLTDIGNRVSRGMTGLWSSFSSGIASSILNRSLGLTNEESNAQASLQPASSAITDPGPPEAPLSMGAGTNIAGGGVVSQQQQQQIQQTLKIHEVNDKKRRLANDTLTAEGAGKHPPTLIDAEIETLYAGFQKRRKSQQSDGARDLGESPEWYEAEERGKRLRKEEAKVRALNSNGRVDFSIQEGVFDISLLASIASHLSYWGDEDVSHFMTSQLLSGSHSRRRI